MVLNSCSQLQALKDKAQKSHPKIPKPTFLLLTTTIFLFSLVLFGWSFSNSNNNAKLAPYNPLSYKKSPSLSGEVNSHQDSVLSSHELLNLDPMNPQRDDLTKIINGGIRDSELTNVIYTFFNEDKISQKSKEEQRYHKTLLRYWITWYQHLGFKIQVLTYADAVNNPMFVEFQRTGHLINEKGLFIEKNLKLLAWNQKLETNGIFIDYSLFLNLDEDQNDKLMRFSEFDKFVTYDKSFGIISSDKDSLINLVSMYIRDSTKTHDLIFTDSTNISPSWFLDYSHVTIGTLMNTDNPRFIFNFVPKLLNHQLRYIKLSSIHNFQLVDLVSISNHHFIQPLMLSIKALTTTPISQNEFFSSIPLPTYDNLIKFSDLKTRKQGESYNKFPPKVTSDDSFNTIKLNNEFLSKIYGDLFPKYSLKIPSITIINQLSPSVLNPNQQMRKDRLSKGDKDTLHFVSWPHPLNVLTVLDYASIDTLTGEKIATTLTERDYISAKLLNLDNAQWELLKKTISQKSKSCFFYNFEMNLHNSELDAMIALNQQLSIDLGIYDLHLASIVSNEHETNSEIHNFLSGDQITDESTDIYTYMKVIPELSHSQITEKLQEIQTNYFQYKDISHRPFKITQRRSVEEINRLREDLSNDNKKPIETIQILTKLLSRDGLIEPRRDPVIEIAENFNVRDSEIWYLIRNSKYVEEKMYQMIRNLLN